MWDLIFLDHCLSFYIVYLWCRTAKGDILEMHELSKVKSACFS